MAKLLDPATGLTPGGELGLAGAATVLRLRSRYARPARALADPAPYLDLSHWRTVTGRA